MFLKKRKVNGTFYWSIAESYRENGKVKQKTIENLGTTDKAIAFLQQSIEYGKFLSELNVFTNKKLGINEIYNMDCREGLKLLDSNSVDCCVTSPPYWGLRDYGVPGQIGLEKSLNDYIDVMVKVFREVKRVLKPSGTLWLNLGDAYVGTGGDRKQAVKNEIFQMQQSHNPGNGRYQRIKQLKRSKLKPKDLMGIPWKVALALQDDGWYLRSDIIWNKTNCMPEAVKDRPTKTHEYIFLLSKERTYYYDHEAIKEPCVNGDPNLPRGSLGVLGGLNSGRRGKGNSRTFRGGGAYTKGQSFNNSATIERESHGNVPNELGLRNKRSVWNVATDNFEAAHFATFPSKLIEPCILAGCPINGIVLDPFMGSGTTAEKSLELQRNYLGFELNSEYIKIAKEYRLNDVQIKIV